MTAERVPLRVTEAAFAAIEALAAASHFDGHCGCPAIPSQGSTISVTATELAWLRRCCGSVIDASDARWRIEDLFEDGYLTAGQQLGMRSAAAGFARQVDAAVEAIGAKAVSFAETRIELAERQQHRVEAALEPLRMLQYEMRRAEHLRRRRAAAVDALSAWRSALAAVRANPTEHSRAEGLKARDDGQKACAAAGFSDAAREINELGHRAWTVAADVLAEVTAEPPQRAAAGAAPTGMSL